VTESSTGLTRKAATPRRAWWPVALALALITLAGLFAIGDLKKFLAVASDVQPLWLVAAIGVTGLAYLSFTGALGYAARLCGFPRSYREILPTSFVSQAVNNLLSSGGLGGLAIRLYGLGQLGIPAGSAAAVSGVATLSNDVVGAVGLLGAVVYIINHSEDLSTRALYTLLALAATVAVLIAGMAIALRSPPIRARILGFIGKYAERIAQKFAQRGAGGVVAGSFREDLLHTFERAIAAPRKLFVPLLFMTTDLALRSVCLWAAFLAIGHPQPLRRVTAGFLIGISAGALSLVPGGIGVLDGSMAAVFSYLGVELEVAAVAVIVFRLAYYVVPLGAVAIFFRPLLRRRAREEVA